MGQGPRHCRRLSLSCLLPLLIFTRLDKQIHHTRRHTLGQIPHLNAYSEYCANYGSALICLNKKAERERMAQFLEKTAPLGQHAKLPDYLILPVQRIPVCIFILAT